MSSICFVYCVVVGLLLCAVKIQAQKIRGTPGVDYPNYHSIPKTSFKCSEQKYIPGFYADLETDCQVFHFCFDHRHESFLCPTGTTFNQPILGCDSWYNSNCSLATLFYVVNAGPGIETAGKKIPLLLKLRDRTKDGFTTIASVSKVLEKISALNEESVQPETNKVSEEGTATVTLDSVEHESNDVGNESEIASKNPETDKLENSISDIQGDQSAGYMGAGQESLDNTLNSNDENLDELKEELNDKSSIPDLIYDPVTDGYYSQNYYSDSEWPSESEPNSQFQNFYDYRDANDLMMQDEGESVQFQNSYEDETYADEEGNKYSEVQNENVPENFQFDGNDMSQGEYYDEMDEFSKRLLQTIKIPKRSRRKPTYIVVDQPNVRVPTRQRQDLYSVLESTENPFAESISIDSVVEESSTEFMQFPADEIEGFDTIENDEITKSDTSEFEKNSEESNWSSWSPSDSNNSEFSDEQAGDDSENPEAKFSENEDGSINAERYLIKEGNRSDSTAEDENVAEGIDSENETDIEEIDTEEDITIYDDSDDPETYESERNIVSDVSIEEQDHLIVIPDETDFPTSSEDSVIDSTNENVEYESNDGSNQNWQYVYSETGEIPQKVDSEDGRYMYENIEENVQGTNEMGNGEIYDPSEYAAQSNYAYQTTYDGINYSPYRPSEYDLTQQAQGYVPESYYQYAPKDQEYFSDQPSEVSYQTPEEDDSDSAENPDFSKFKPMDDFSRGSSNVPNLYSYESSNGQSYGYDYVYPQRQESGYMNDYPYSPQYGYSYQNMDGSSYSNEGESPSSVESEYVTESSNAELPLAPEYEGLQETWAQADFESENSEATGEEESEANDSKEFEAGGGYTISYDDELSSEGSNVGLDMKDTGIGSENFQGLSQNEETYYVLEDDDDVTSNLDVKETAEETEAESNETSDDDRRFPMLSDSSFDHKDVSEKYIFDKFEPSKAVNGPEVVYSDSESTSNILNGKGKLKDGAVSEFGIKSDSILDETSNPTQDSWPSHSPNNVKGGEETETPSSGIEHLAGVKPTKIPSTIRDFAAPTETQFLNSMPFPNSMAFSQYGGFGPNMGQQFAMMDSSNMAPFSKIGNRIPPEALNSGMSRLSKLSSLQEKVRSMKGGKFGMFKKYMNSMKN